MHILKFFGAGNGSRTHLRALGRPCTTDVLYLQKFFNKDVIIKKNKKQLKDFVKFVWNNQKIKQNGLKANIIDFIKLYIIIITRYKPIE